MVYKNYLRFFLKFDIFINRLIEYFFMVYFKKRYFYNGIIDIDNSDQNETIKFLEVHDELNFNQGKKEWIHQNLMNFNEIPYQFPQLFLFKIN